ncbi:hypothetical protein V8C86DRAFT_997741 [Haematococcus lacustris]
MNATSLTRRAQASPAFRQPAACRQAAPALSRRYAVSCSAGMQNRNSLGEAVDTMLKRYDFLSAGAGALIVTGYCWSQGQNPITALSVTATSTIFALVVNELWTALESRK